MNDNERRIVKSQIADAYDKGLMTHAYYLELCLKVNELPSK